MSVIRRIDPLSAFKVGLIINGLVGLLLGIFCTVVTAAGVALARHAHISLLGVGLGSHIGLFAIILCPIVYGVIGGVGVALGALIYNLASSWIGGLEIEMG